MKRCFSLIFLFFTLLSIKENKVLASSFPFDNFEKRFLRRIEPRIQGSKNFDIFSDSEFKIPTHNFSFGQKIYVRITLNGSGEGQRIIRLLDAGKNEVDKVSPNQEGNNPYIYTAIFMAPSKEGVYYVDVKIEDGEGFSFAGQQNISVGGGSTRPVSSRAESRVSVSEESSSIVTPSLTTVTPPIVTPKLKEPSVKIITFFAEAIEFLRKFLFGLTNKEG